MTTALTSRERLRRALARQQPDHVPCALMSFSALRGRCQDAYEVALAELEMGLDSMLFIPSSWRNVRPNHPDLRGLPVRLPATVKMRLWSDREPGESYDTLTKEYHTPDGVLTTQVRRSADWPHGSFLPLFDDYQIPRAIKPLVTGPEDLPALQHLLQPPSAEDIAAYRAEAERAHAFRDAHGVLLGGGWGVGADMASWLCGLERLMLLAVDQPEMLQELLGIIEAWSLARTRAVLAGKVDLFLRRAWYEGTDFWSPTLHRRFLLPQLQREAALVHDAGARYGLIMTTGALPLAKNLLESGIDVLVGVDPLQRGERPLETLRDTLSRRVCLWGGVNGAITVEEGTPEEVRRAVHTALATMRGVPGFILSPVDNITSISRQTWENVAAFIAAWQAER